MARKQQRKGWVGAGVFVVVLLGCVLPDARAQVPITTGDLRRIVGNPQGLTGIQYNRYVGLLFQHDVLECLPGPKMTYANTKRFESKERDRQTQGQFVSVIPDGVAGASIGTNTPLPPLITTYPESTFIEVKAVKGKLDLAYGRHQILGMLDALTKTQAASSTGANRAYPALYLVTTADAFIDPDVWQEGIKKTVLVWHSYVVLLPNGQIQVASPACLNCVQVLQKKQLASTLPPGAPFVLGARAARPISNPFDLPILDDSLVGFPGSPGNTTPNP